jgi:hypothetical protein
MLKFGVHFYMITSLKLFESNFHD